MRGKHQKGSRAAALIGIWVDVKLKIWVDVGVIEKIQLTLSDVLIIRSVWPCLAFVCVAFALHLRCICVAFASFGILQALASSL